MASGQSSDLSVANETPSKNTTVLLLTHARCASHVLERMLSEQPNMSFESEFFMESRLPRRALFRDGPIEQADATRREKFMVSVRQSYSELLEFLKDADRNDRTAFAHVQPHVMISPQVTSDFLYRSRGDPNYGRPGAFLAESNVGEDRHTSHTNPTVVPDWVFLRSGTVPIINFRHPILIADGLYRGFRSLPAMGAADDSLRPLMSIGASLHIPRLMYDWFVKHGRPSGIRPILLDADDFLGPEKEALMQQVCARVPGFDAGAVIYSWPAASTEKLAGMPDLQRQVHQTILGSSGVMSGYDMRDRSIESETAKWVEKYGKDEAEFLRGLVGKAMPDYEYLRSQRLRPDGTVSNVP